MLTPEDYLELERKAEGKSEYYQGEMFAMPGATLIHNRLVMRIMCAFHDQLRRSPCEVYASNMRVHAADFYAYPDVVVVCGEPRLQDSHLDTLLNPILLVEVLSHSSEAYDRGRKFERYQSIESPRWSPQNRP